METYIPSILYTWPPEFMDDIGAGGEVYPETPGIHIR